MTHWKSLINLDYIGAYAMNGKDKILTIAKVQKEVVTGQNGKKDECIVAYFADEEKPMILNRTNCKTIQKLHGTPHIEEWANKKIQVFASTTKLAGETVECLRIRPYINEDKPVELCADCGSPIQATERMSAEGLKLYTVKNYGRQLCATCLKPLYEAKENQNIQIK